MNHKNFFALIIFIVGVIFTSIANFGFEHVNANTVSDAIINITNGNSADMLKLWVCALLGITLLAGGTILMGKLSWESIQYYSYETNPIVNIVITLIMASITLFAAYYTSLTVMGLIIITFVVVVLLNSTDTRRT